MKNIGFRDFFFWGGGVGGGGWMGSDDVIVLDRLASENFSNPAPFYLIFVMCHWLLVGYRTPDTPYIYMNSIFARHLFLLFILRL